jgi:hypothetical protein
MEIRFRDQRVTNFSDLWKGLWVKCLDRCDLCRLNGAGATENKKESERKLVYSSGVELQLCAKQKIRKGKKKNIKKESSQISNLLIINFLNGEQRRMEWIEADKVNTTKHQYHS